MSESPKVRLLEDLRWTCTSCGECCRRFALGPVEPEVIRKLAGWGIERVWHPAAVRPWYGLRKDDTGESHFFLSHRGDACVFLHDDGLCESHARLGSASKPAFCREFPFSFVSDSRGFHGWVRPHCSRFFHTFQDSELALPEAEAALALTRMIPIRVFNPDLVAVLPGMGIPLPVFHRIEDALIERALPLDKNEEPETTVGRLRSFLYELVQKREPLPRSESFESAISATFDNLAGFLPGHASLEKASFTDSTRAFLNLLLRQVILGRQFSASGGIPEGLGRFLLDVAVVRRFAQHDEKGVASPENAAAALTAWARRLDFPDARAAAARAREAMIILFMNAERP